MRLDLSLCVTWYCEALVPLVRFFLFLRCTVLALPRAYCVICTMYAAPCSIRVVVYSTLLCVATASENWITEQQYAFYRQLLISHTFSTNSVHWVSNLVKNKPRKRTISGVNTQFKVMTTYEVFQSSTKIISKENLIYIGETFITVHTAVIKKICSTLGVTQESPH